MSSLEDFAIEIVAEPEKDFNNAMGQESLTRFDQPRNKKRNNNKNKKRKPFGADKKPSSENNNEPKIKK